MPRRMPIPLTLRNGKPFQLGYPAWRLCNLLNALAVPDYRTIEEGAVEPAGLDAESRRRAGNRLNVNTAARVNASRKINKALSMELTMSSLLAHFDSPRQVRI